MKQLKKTMNKTWAFKIYHGLLEQHGPQQWWPAKSRFEVMVGAILTQNTAWTNVERAIENLKKSYLLDPIKINTTKQDRLAKYIKPSGYFNVKAKRLKNYCGWYVESGRYERLRYWSTNKLRKELLNINGVGAETADDILLYAFNRNVFVIDAYTRRIFSRLGCIDGDEEYDEIRAIFETQLPKKSKLFAEYHALIVNHGKDICKTKPTCDECNISKQCKNFAEVI